MMLLGINLSPLFIRVIADALTDKVIAYLDAKNRERQQSTHRKASQN